MPKGVEHVNSEQALSFVVPVIPSLMPKGVEHMKQSRMSAADASRDSFVDAERR